MKLRLLTSPKLLLSILLCGSIYAGYAQSSLFSSEKYTNGKGDTLKYRQLFPDYDTIRKYPLVIFLHGSGERGNDNEAQLKWGVKNFASDENMKQHPAFVIAPQCPERSQWSNFSYNRNSPNILLQKSPSKPMALLIALIHEFVKKFPVDTNRIYITGLSMGGFGTFDAIERYPNLFAAAVPVCGGGDISMASTIKHIPIWIFHGAEDAAVDPTLSLNMIEALTKAGAHPGYTQYPEVGHFSWIAAYSDPLMMEWLFRQHK
ncbi:phospholipase/carboxylesterase [mine drainage metagenome]|uniref:Phospholipase/carboxylesterase n=1 Tax=mine drainage metagenome TaxID=410659 RepID=A0A1J5RKF4_9ZZZZ